MTEPPTSAREAVAHPAMTANTTNDKPREVINGVRVTRFPTYAPNDAYYFSPQITRYMQFQTYDIIHIHNYNALPALFAIRAKGITRKVVFTPHYHQSGHTLFRNMIRIPYAFAGKYIFDHSDFIVCVSEYEKKLIEKTFDIHNRMAIIPNGLTLSEFDRFKDFKKDRNREQKILLYVGRLEEYKGIQYILRAMPEMPEVELRIVGKGIYSEKLLDLSESLKIDQRIKWYTDLTRPELLKMYADADVFLMLSTREAFGISVAEALTAGTPCVVVKGSALEEFVDDKVCLGIDQPINISDIVTSVRSLYSQEERYEGKLLDWDDVVNQLLTVFSVLKAFPI